MGNVVFINSQVCKASVSLIPLMYFLPLPPSEIYQLRRQSNSLTRRPPHKQTHTHTQRGGSYLKSFFYRLTASIMTITRRTIKGIATARAKLGGEKSRPQSLNVSNCRQGIWHGICAQISACSWLIFKAARIFMLDYKFPARLDLLQAISFSLPAQPLILASWHLQLK